LKEFLTIIPKCMKPLKTQPLLIRGENGLTTNSTEQAKIVAEHFRNTFFKNAEPMDNIPETPIRTPFTVIEINKAVNKIKNKNPGYDEILELIKHSPLVIFQTIANIYNNMAETNDIPKEKSRILKPLQKPGKAKGPPPTVNHPAIITKKNSSSIAS